MDNAGLNTVYRAASVSTVVDDWLLGGIRNAQVLAVFTRVVNVLVERDGRSEVIAICQASVGNGPLNILLDDWPDWRALAVGSPVLFEDKILQLGQFRLDCSDARLWNPVPPWEEIHGKLAIDTLREKASAYGDRSALLAWVCGDASIPQYFAQGLQQLQRGIITRNRQEIAQGARCLAGLGEGLTPAGDDFLCGLMIGFWASQRDASQICEVINRETTADTTTLSAALLARAAAGQVNADWMRLLTALAMGKSPEASIARIVAMGHSSGADMLAGFLLHTSLSL